MDKNNEDESWEGYYKAVSNNRPREMLERALKLFKSDKPKKKSYFAIDLGCGNGPDTIELLRNGWKVQAIDAELAALRIIEKCISEDYKDMLETKCCTFEEIQLPKADLINASYSLPFCKPEYFEGLWHKITDSIEAGGRFSGNLFGIKDTWAIDENMNFHTKEEVKKLFQGFEIEYFREWEKDGTTATGEAKHWHVFDIVARKNDFKIIDL